MAQTPQQTLQLILPLTARVGQPCLITVLLAGGPGCPIGPVEVTLARAQSDLSLRGTALVQPCEEDGSTRGSAVFSVVIDTPGEALFIASASADGYPMATGQLVAG